MKWFKRKSKVGPISRIRPNRETYVDQTVSNYALMSLLLDSPSQSAADNSGGNTPSDDCSSVSDNSTVSESPSYDSSPSYSSYDSGSSYSYDSGSSDSGSSFSSCD